MGGKVCLSVVLLDPEIKLVYCYEKCSWSDRKKIGKCQFVMLTKIWKRHNAHCFLYCILLLHIIFSICYSGEKPSWLK